VSGSLADVLPRVEKPERRDIHTVEYHEGGYTCQADWCGFRTDDLGEVAAHVVRNQWQSR
jgi:hypothetical protein